MKTTLKLTTALFFLCTIAFAQQKRTIATKSKLLTETVVTTQAKTEGGPVKGIIIKGGKNPGGNIYVIVTTTKDGSFSCKLDEGNYTISVNADELKKTILELKREGERINGATFVFDLPANFEFSGTEKPNEKGEYVIPKFEFTIKVPKEGITFSGKLLTTSTAGLSIKPTINEKGTGSPKQQGF